MPAPLGGLGQPPRAAPAPRLPVEGADGTHFIDTAEVRSVRADAHYTRVHDGTRERMCPWSISEAEAQLDPGLFVRVHRSHIVAIPHVTLRPQGRRRRGDRTRRPVAASRAGEPRQDRRGQGPARPRQAHAPIACGRIRSQALTHFVREHPHFVRISAPRDARRRRLALRTTPEQPCRQRPRQQRQKDGWRRRMIPGPFSYHRPATRGRCGQTAVDARRRGPAAGRRPQPDPDDEAAARHARTSGRSARHRRPEGHPPRRRHAS